MTSILEMFYLCLISWKSIWIYLKSQIELWNLKFWFRSEKVFSRLKIHFKHFFQSCINFQRGYGQKGRWAYLVAFFAKFIEILPELVNMATVYSAVVLGQIWPRHSNPWSKEAYAENFNKFGQKTKQNATK